jgi:hypothetical protein
MGASILAITPKKVTQKAEGKNPSKNPMSYAYVFQEW